MNPTCALLTAVLLAPLAALQAAARGHQVALVEQSDFAKGTTTDQNIGRVIPEAKESAVVRFPAYDRADHNQDAWGTRHKPWSRLVRRLVLRGGLI